MWSCDGKSWSYAQLRRAVDAFKFSFIRPDHGTAVLTAQPTFNFLVKFFALLELDVSQAIFPADCSVEQQVEYANILGASYTFDEDDGVVWLNDSIVSSVSRDAAVVLFTSGSSGQPKGVQLSLKNIMAACQAISQSLSFSDVSQQWLLLNLHYSFGLLGQLLPAVCAGVHTQRVGHILSIVRAAADNKLSGMLSGVPTQLSALCQLLAREKRVVASVSHVVLAGAAATPALRLELCKTFPEATIYVNYGQTEASPRILCLSSQDAFFHSEATGYAVGNLKTEIADDGELLVAGDQIMIGYLGDAANPVVDGWLHTGDLASKNGKGLITVRGRKDAVVKVGGKKVSLIEVEAALGALMGVSAAVVVSMDEEAYGSALYALLVLNNVSLDHATLLSLLSKRLPPHSIPSRFYRTENLPTNANGKVDRKKVYAFLQERRRIV